jgi:TolB-like protein/Tfp pilus assembly protein PilF
VQVNQNNRSMNFLAEFKRRNVHRMAGLYLVAAWLVVQVAGTVLPMFDAPAWLSRATVIVLAIGFIPALVFAWAFEITPEGLKRESEIDRAASITPHTGKRMDRIITGVLVVALVYFAIDKFVLAPQREAAMEQQQAAQLSTVAEEARAEGRTEAIVESYGDKSIAVLPFTDMSSAKDQEYMADGLAEELLNLLAQIPELRVISRSSAFSYKGKDVKLAQIARELSVAHILEGSVRKGGNTVRVTAQLIEARTDTHLWSATYDRPLDDIFAVQDEIAAAVVERLKLVLLVPRPKVRTTDPKAYELYLQGRLLEQQSSVEGFSRGRALLEQALSIDPQYAPAWDALAANAINRTTIGAMSPKEGYAEARHAVTQALTLDPAYAPAHVRMGWIMMNADNDLAGAAAQFQRGIAIEPSSPMVLGNAAVLLRNLGRLDEALALEEFLVRDDPLDVITRFNLGNRQMSAGRFDDAITSYQVVLSLSAQRGGARYRLGVAHLLRGDASRALAEIDQERSEVWRLIGQAIAYHALGRTAESDAALAALVEKYARDWSYNIASVHAFRGEADSTFDLLRKAVEYQDSGLPEIVGERLFDNVRSDPRWLPFLREIGKAPEQLAAIKFDVKLPQQ